MREVLNEVERDCILKHGYGMHSFAHALVDTFERLSVEPITPALHETISGFAHAIAENPIEVLSGVSGTLEYLAPRHQLILVTKGNITEQSGKVERSGLKHLFNAVEIVAEKNRATYNSLVEKYGLQRDVTWMVGNSPRSDVNPALAAGISAVFVPHDQTWVLEHELLAEPRGRSRLLVVEQFADLQSHF